MLVDLEAETIFTQIDNEVIVPVSVTFTDFENVIGTDAIDFLRGDGEANVISGGNSTDFINGGAGNDILVGNKGDDSVFGEAGDDLLVWNNGDGSDLLDGGDGVDQVQVNFNTDLVNDDLANDDVAEIKQNGENVLFERVEVNGQTAVGLFALDIRNTEAIEVNFGDGDDTARIDDLLFDDTFEITLNGGGDDVTATPDEAAGDTLDLSLVTGIEDVTIALDQGIFVDGTVDFGASTGEAGVVELGFVTDFEERDAFATLAVLNDFENIIGSEAGEDIFGNNQANVIEGGGREDFIFGGGGADQIFGGDDDDELTGNKGDDFVFGGAGDDLIIWNNGDGSDLFNGGAGFDTVQVNFFTDDALGGRSPVEEDLDNDDVAEITQNGDNVRFERVEVNGQSVNGLFALDIQEVEALEVNFGAGDDTARLDDLIFTDFEIQLEGGDGVDTLDFAAASNGVFLDLDIGGIVPTDEDGFTIDAATNTDVVEFENVIGTGFADDLRGTGGANALSGGGGDDSLLGDGGDDILSGGDGADEVFGGNGDDELFGGAGDDRLNGDGNNDILVGGTGDDVLNGGNGNDTLNGGAGADQLNGGRGLDIADFSDSDAAVTVNLQNFTFSGGHAEGDRANGVDGIIGSAFGDTLTGFDQQGSGFTNVIDGGAGDDTIDGRAGDDTLSGGDGSDTVLGGDGNDTIEGNSGDDILVAGAGNDNLAGGIGDDVFIFGTNDDQNEITDFVAGGNEDAIDLTATAIGSFEALIEDNAVQEGDDVRIFGLGGTTEILLRDTDINDLAEQDFILAPDLMAIELGIIDIS